MTTLLERAKSLDKHGGDRQITDDEIELALAWLRDEVTLSQIAGAKSGNRRWSTAAYGFLAIALREAWRRDIISGVPNKP